MGHVNHETTTASDRRPAPLADLPGLTEVQFNGCSGAPTLKQVVFWGCRDNGVLPRVIHKLKASGVNVFCELDDDT